MSKFQEKIKEFIPLILAEVGVESVEHLFKQISIVERDLMSSATATSDTTTEDTGNESSRLNSELKSLQDRESRLKDGMIAFVERELTSSFFDISEDHKKSSSSHLKSELKRLVDCESRLKDGMSNLASKEVEKILVERGFSDVSALHDKIEETNAEVLILPDGFDEREIAVKFLDDLNDCKAEIDCISRICGCLREPAITDCVDQDVLLPSFSSSSSSAPAACDSILLGGHICTASDGDSQLMPCCNPTTTGTATGTVASQLPQEEEEGTVEWLFVSPLSSPVDWTDDQDLLLALGLGTGNGSTATSAPATVIAPTAPAVAVAAFAATTASAPLTSPLTSAVTSTSAYVTAPALATAAPAVSVSEGHLAAAAPAVSMSEGHLAAAVSVVSERHLSAAAVGGCGVSSVVAGCSSSSEDGPPVFAEEGVTTTEKNILDSSCPSHSATAVTAVNAASAASATAAAASAAGATTDPVSVVPAPPPPAPAPLVRCLLQQQWDELHSSLHHTIVATADCAEKSLTILVKYFELLTKETGDRQVTTLSPSDILGYIHGLRSQLEEEEIGNIQVMKVIKHLSELFHRTYKNHHSDCGTAVASSCCLSSSSSSSSALSSFDRPADVTDAFLELGQTAQRALNAIRTLDIQRLLTEVRCSMKSEDAIRGKDVILLVGTTGTGKSTLIHYFAGAEMVKNSERFPGYRKHVEPKIVLPGLEVITLSPIPRSETRGVHAVSIQCDGKEYLVCDTAGLSDTAGPEIDIANGIVMSRTIQAAQSVKIVLVLTAGQFDNRCIMLSTFLRSIAQFMAPLSQRTQYLFYLINKGDEDTIHDVRASTADIVGTMTMKERSDVDFAAIIEDLTAKSESGDCCSTVNIFDGGRKRLLELIDASVAPVDDPKSFFNSFASRDALQLLSKQLLLHERAVLNAIARREFCIVKLKLNEMRQLRDCIGISECETKYVECVRTLMRKIQVMFDGALDLLEKRVFFEGAGGIIPSMTLEEDMAACLHDVFTLIAVEPIRMDHIDVLSEQQQAEFPPCIAAALYRAIDSKMNGCLKIVLDFVNRVTKDSREELNSMQCMGGKQQGGATATVISSRDINKAMASLLQMNAFASAVEKTTIAGEGGGGGGGRRGQCGVSDLDPTVKKITALSSNLAEGRTVVGKAFTEATGQLLASIRNRVFEVSVITCHFKVLRDLGQLDSSALDLPLYATFLQLQEEFKAAVSADCNEIVSDMLEGADEISELTIDNFITTLQRVSDLVSDTLFVQVVPDVVKHVVGSQAVLVNCVKVLCGRIREKLLRSAGNNNKEEEEKRDFDILKPIEGELKVISSLWTNSEVLRSLAVEPYSMVMKEVMKAVVSVRDRTITSIRVIESGHESEEAIAAASVALSRDLVSLYDATITLQTAVALADTDCLNDFEAVMSLMAASLKEFRRTYFTEKKSKDGVAAVSIKLVCRKSEEIRSMLHQKLRPIVLQYDAITTAFAANHPDTDTGGGSSATIACVRTYIDLYQETLESLCRDIRRVADVASDVLATFSSNFQALATTTGSKTDDHSFIQGFLDSLFFFSATAEAAYLLQCPSIEEHELLSELPAVFSDLAGQTVFNAINTIETSLSSSSSSGELVDESICRKLKTCLDVFKQLHKSLLSYVEGGIYVLSVRDQLAITIQDASVALTALALNIDNESSGSDLSNDDACHFYSICDCLSSTCSVDKYIIDPSTGSNIRFETVAKRIKQAISNSTRSKIQTHQFTAVLDDLLKMAATEIDATNVDAYLNELLVEMLKLHGSVHSSVQQMFSLGSTPGDAVCDLIEKLDSISSTVRMFDGLWKAHHRASEVFRLVNDTIGLISRKSVSAISTVDVKNEFDFAGAEVMLSAAGIIITALLDKGMHPTGRADLEKTVADKREELQRVLSAAVDRYRPLPSSLEDIKHVKVLFNRLKKASKVSAEDTRYSAAYDRLSNVFHSQITVSLTKIAEVISNTDLTAIDSSVSLLGGSDDNSLFLEQAEEGAQLQQSYSGMNVPPSGRSRDETPSTLAAPGIANSAQNAPSYADVLTTADADAAKIATTTSSSNEEEDPNAATTTSTKKKSSSSCRPLEGKAKKAAKKKARKQAKRREKRCLQQQRKKEEVDGVGDDDDEDGSSSSSESESDTVEEEEEEYTEDLSTLPKCESHLELIIALKDYLPIELVKSYESQLNSVLDSLSKLKNDHQMQIDKEASYLDADRIAADVHKFVIYAKNCQIDFAYDWNQALNARLRDLVTRLCSDLRRECSIGSVFDMLSPCFKAWNYYAVGLNSWASDYSKMRYTRGRVFPRNGRYKSYVVNLDLVTPLNLVQQLLRAVVDKIAAAIADMKTTTSLSGIQPCFQDLNDFFDLLVLAKSQAWNSSASLLLENLEHVSGRRLVLDARYAMGKVVAVLDGLCMDIHKKVDDVNESLKDAAQMSPTDIMHISEGFKEANDALTELRNNLSFFNTVRAMQSDPDRFPGNNTTGTVKLLPSYDDLQQYLNSCVEHLLIVVKTPFYENKELKTPNAADRDTFYGRVQVALTLLTHMEQSQALAAGTINMHKYESDCIAHIKSEIDRIGSATENLVGTTHYDLYAVWYDNLRSIDQVFELRDLKTLAKSRMEACDRKFFDEIIAGKREGALLSEGEYDVCLSVGDGDSASKTVYRKKVVKALCDLKSVTVNIALYASRVNKEIDGILAEYDNRSDGSTFINDLIEYMAELCDTASSSDGPLVSQLLKEHSAFVGYNVKRLNELFLGRGVDSVLADLEGNGINEESKKRLKRNYELFEAEYSQLVQLGLNPLEKQQDRDRYLDSLIDTAKKLATAPKLQQSAKIRSMLTYVFAYWTLTASKHYQKSMDEAAMKSASTYSDGSSSDPVAVAVRKNTHLLQPHAAQVIGIMRTFSLDSEPVEDISMLTGLITTLSEYASTATKWLTGPWLKQTSASGAATPAAAAVKNQQPIVLSNNAVQIKTGEGKSVTLAATAILLGLVGYEVDVVCYSEYLSERDRLAFQSMFTAFGLDKAVTYGTFKVVCEKFLNSGGDIRAITKSRIESSSSSSSSGHISGISSEASNTAATSLAPKRKRVLLIDEMDVFFAADFYVSIYKPLATIASPQFTALVRKLWTVRDDKRSLMMSKVKLWSEYKACVDRYAGWEQLVEETVKTVLYDLTTFEDHDYHVDSRRDRIGYKDHDGISYTRTLSYKTMFANFKEHVAGNISAEGLDRSIAMQINCGSFSYAEIPKLYAYTLGVTGTLRELSAGEQDLLINTYGVDTATYLPSVYDSNKLRYSEDDVLITEDTLYHSAIVDEITKRLQGNIATVPRAVLVFFESKKALNDFRDSRQMQHLKGQVRVMQEGMSNEERELAVRKAVSSGSITLLTRDFGRGTDFFVFDKRLDASGGVHVLQTFVSSQLSEQVQIMGRTARQGNNGSYSMVLKETELEGFGLFKREVTSMTVRKERQKIIDARRQAKYDADFDETIKHAKTSMELHYQSQQYLEALQSSSYTAGIEYCSKSFVIERNRFMGSVMGDGKAKATVICLIDATGSMATVLERTKLRVKEMVIRAYEMLESQHIDGALEMQFAVYRNYRCGEDYLLEHSTWETSPDNLRLFLNGVRAMGGQGREAIEIGLSHVNDELDAGKEVTQVILIGDAPPNTRDEVQGKRESAGGKHYWRDTKYATATYYRNELKRIVDRNVCINALYVSNGNFPTETMRASYGEIADCSPNGVCAELDITSSQGAEMLTQLVTTGILSDIGLQCGGDAKDRLLKAYMDKYGVGGDVAGTTL